MATATFNKMTTYINVDELLRRGERQMTKQLPVEKQKSKKLMVKNALTLHTRDNGKYTLFFK